MEWQEAYRIACFAQNYCEDCKWNWFNRCFSLAYKVWLGI